MNERKKIEPGQPDMSGNMRELAAGLAQVELSASVEKMKRGGEIEQLKVFGEGSLADLLFEKDLKKVNEAIEVFRKEGGEKNAAGLLYGMANILFMREVIRGYPVEDKTVALGLCLETVISKLLVVFDERDVSRELVEEAAKLKFALRSERGKDRDKELELIEQLWHEDVERRDKERGLMVSFNPQIGGE